MEELRLILGTPVDGGDSFFRKLQFGMEWAPRSPMVREHLERVLSAKYRLPHRAVLREVVKQRGSTQRNLESVDDDPRDARALKLLAAARASVALISSAMHVQALPTLREVIDDVAAMVKAHSVIEVVRKERLLRLWASPSLGSGASASEANGLKETNKVCEGGRLLDRETAVLLASTLVHASDAERVGVSLGLSLLDDCLALVSWLDMPILLYRWSERWRESLDIVLAVLDALSEQGTLNLPRELVAREMEFLLPSSSLETYFLDADMYDTGAITSVIERLVASITPTSGVTATAHAHVCLFDDGGEDKVGSDVRRAILLHRLLPCLPPSGTRNTAQEQLQQALHVCGTYTSSPLVAAALVVVCSPALRPGPSGMAPIKEDVWHSMRTPMPQTCAPISGSVSSSEIIPNCASIRALYEAQAEMVDHEVATSRSAQDRLHQICMGSVGPALLLGHERKLPKRRVEQGGEERETGPREWYGGTPITVREGT